MILDDDVDTGDKMYLIRGMVPNPLPAGSPSISFSDPPGNSVPLDVADNDRGEWMEECEEFDRLTIVVSIKHRLIH